MQRVLGECCTDTLPDLIALIQPTSPLTEGRHIDEAIRVLQNSGADSLVSVVPFNRFTWTCGWPNYDPVYRPRGQDFGSHMENGAIYLTTIKQWQQTSCRLGGSIAQYVMTEQHGREIDTFEDLNAVGRLLWLRELKKSRPLTLVFDLDGVICDTNGVDYRSASPRIDMILRMQLLKNEGHQIIIQTARGALSGIDWRPFTEQQLAQWLVPYDRLSFDKPAGDLYIDDRAILMDELRAWQDEYTASG